MLKKNLHLEISRGSRRLTVFFSRCFALILLPLTPQWWQPPFGAVEYDRDDQLTGVSLFPSTDFSSLHFPKTSWEHGERKHIKDSYSCCELGSQKRTTKGYLHTHCKAFFFTLNTSHLKAFNYVQPARKMTNCLSDTNFCWLGLFSWKIKYLIFMTFIYDCFTNTTVINKKNWTLCPLWIIRVQSSCTWVLPLVWGHYNRWHDYIISSSKTGPELGDFFWLLQ